MFTILISMDLAIVNLLPWPALDGGHLAFMTLEAIRRKPMQEKFQGEIVKWGFLSLLALMVVVMVNDVTALVTGKLDMKPRENKNVPANTTAPAPANTTAPAPANTAAPAPANTAAPAPANTSAPAPADTATPAAADTPAPTHSDTTAPVPTNIPAPGPANTAAPAPAK
jgi:hypothetical protein